MSEPLYRIQGIAKKWKKKKWKKIYIDPAEWSVQVDPLVDVYYIVCDKCRRFITGENKREIPDNCHGCARDVPDNLYKAKIMLEKLNHYR